MKPHQLFTSGLNNLMVMTKLPGAKYNLFLFEAAGVKPGKFQKFLYYCSPIIYILLLVYTLFYILIKFLLTILTSFIYKNQKSNLIGHDVGLIFTNLTVSRVKTAELYDSISDWIIGPNIQCDRSNLNNVVEYKSHLSIIDYCLVLKLCILSLVHYCCHYTCLSLVYNNWSFYEAYIALLKIAPGNNVYYANQSDNWAIMLDSIPFKSRTLIQHGYVGNVDVPNRLKGIDCFYALSKKASEDALDSIFACKPEVKIIKPTIKLKDYNDNKFKILLVLDVRFFEIEKKIIEYLQKDGISVYLKKHPSLTNDSDYRKLVKKYNLIYITEQIFPKVDYVISYNSTLAREYMVYEIPVYIYTNDNRTYNESEIKKELNQQLKNI